MKPLSPQQEMWLIECLGLDPAELMVLKVRLESYGFEVTGFVLPASQVTVLGLPVTFADVQAPAAIIDQSSTVKVPS